MPVVLGRNEKMIARAMARAAFIERYMAKHGLSRKEAAARLNMSRAEINGVLDRAAQRRIKAEIAGF